MTRKHAHRLMAGVATAGVIVAISPAAYASAPPRAVLVVQRPAPSPHGPHPHVFASPAAVPAMAAGSGRRSDTVQLTTSLL
jgi:hypothetical protein